MKVLLLNSPWINNEKEYGIKSGTRWAAIRKRERTMPYFPYPYYMATASAVLKASGIDVHVKDAINEEMSEDSCIQYIKDLAPNLVIMEPYTPSIDIDKEFAKRLKKEIECWIAFCGAHTTALPEEALAEPSVDFVLLGEYEYTLRDLSLMLEKKEKNFNLITSLAYRVNNKISINTKRAAIDPLDELPFPDFDALSPADYNEPLSRNCPHVKIVSSRGCPYNCVFCVEPLLFDQVYRMHSVDYIIRLVQHSVEQYGVKEIYFDDDIFTIGRAKEIAQALIDHNMVMPWSCWMHWNVSVEDLSLLKKSGCFAIKFGVESANNEVLRQANKQGVDIANIRRLVNDCKKIKMLAHGSFMLGLPGETKDSMKETIDLAFSLKLDACQFSIATPLPGTLFYKMAKDNKWLVSDDWAQYEGLEHCVVNYPECSRQDILDGMEIVRQKKVKQFLKDPLKAVYYIWKLYRIKGWNGFWKTFGDKSKFAIKALLERK